MARIDLIQIRGGAALQWAFTNPVLDVREMGVETDTGGIKFGDGTTAWRDLPYASNHDEPIDIIADAGTINLDMQQSSIFDVSIENLAGDPASFTVSNDDPGQYVTVRVTTDAARSISFPVQWSFSTAKPTAMGAGESAVLSVSCFGHASTDIVAAWAVLNA